MHTNNAETVLNAQSTTVQSADSGRAVKFATGYFPSMGMSSWRTAAASQPSQPKELRHSANFGVPFVDGGHFIWSATLCRPRQLRERPFHIFYPYSTALVGVMAEFENGRNSVRAGACDCSCSVLQFPCTGSAVLGWVLQSRTQIKGTLLAMNMFVCENLFCNNWGRCEYSFIMIYCSCRCA